jgi:hypothetical protein
MNNRIYYILAAALFTLPKLHSPPSKGDRTCYIEVITKTYALAPD